MFLSKRSNGIYYLWYRDSLGKKHKVSTGATTKAEALAFVRAYKQRGEETARRITAITLQLFGKEYQDHIAGQYTPKSQEVVRYAFSEFVRIVGDLPLAAVGIREIEHFLQVKISTASQWTARKYYGSLASAFESGVRWGYLETNPFRKVGKPSPPEHQPSYMTVAEFKELLQATDDPDLRDLYAVGVMTGLRLGEIAALTWADVDLTRGILFVRNSDRFTTKSKRNRVVPLNAYSVGLLQSRRGRRTCDLVFHRNGGPMTKDYLSKAFKRTVLRARLPANLHFHSLRHTFASWLVQQGESIHAVSKILGHSSVVVTERFYAHLDPAQLHSTVERLPISMS